MQGLVTDFRWRIGADLIQGNLSLPCELSDAALLPPTAVPAAFAVPSSDLAIVLASASFSAAAPALLSSSASTPEPQKPTSAASAATSSFHADQDTKGYHAAFMNDIAELGMNSFDEDECERFDGSLDKHQDADLENRAGVELGSLAAGRQKLKDEMFAKIVHFRANRRNGIRKFDKLKTAFQQTYLRITCTDKADVSTLKKKCGRIWACIEYAILEFVDISTFDCSHVERMQVKHKEYLLSRMCTKDGSEVEDKPLTPLITFPVDDQAALVHLPTTLSPRRSGREKPKPDPKLHQEKGKKQNDVCVHACVCMCVCVCLCLCVCENCQC